MTKNELTVERVKDKVEIIARALNEILERYGAKKTDLTVIKNPEYWSASQEDILKVISFAVESLYDIDDITAEIE